MFTLSQPSTGYCRILHTSGVAKLRHTGARALETRRGAPPMQVSMRIGALLVANWALNSLEIELRRHSNPQNYCAPFAPSASGDWHSSSIFQSPDIVLVSISHHFLPCITLHLKTFRTRSTGWALFGVNFRPLQEIEAMMRGGRIFDTGPFFARLRYYSIALISGTIHFNNFTHFWQAAATDDSN